MDAAARNHRLLVRIQDRPEMTRYTTRPIAWAVGPEGAALYSERVTVIEPHSTPAQFPRRACRTALAGKILRQWLMVWMAMKKRSMSATSQARVMTIWNPQLHMPLGSFAPCSQPPRRPSHDRPRPRTAPLRPQNRPPCRRRTRRDARREECIAESRAVARLLRFCVHFCVHPHHPAYGYSASPIGATGKSVRTNERPSSKMR